MSSKDPRWFDKLHAEQNADIGIEFDPDEDWKGEPYSEPIQEYQPLERPLETDIPVTAQVGRGWQGARRLVYQDGSQVYERDEIALGDGRIFRVLHAFPDWTCQPEGMPPQEMEGGVAGFVGDVYVELKPIELGLRWALGYPRISADQYRRSG
jgi:hypothetical protein